MPSDLFRQVVDPRPSTRPSRFSALPVSVGLHALVLFALIVIPLLAADVLPLVQDPGTLEMPAILVPTPPTPPPPVGSRTVPSTAVNPNLAPFEAPNGIREEQLIPDTTPVDVSAPPTGVVSFGEPLPSDTIVVDTPPPRPSAPVPVGRLLKPPVKIRDVAPVYPEMAIRTRIEGIVIVEAIIGPTGDIQDAKVLRGKPFLDEAALAAVRQWKYTPSTLGGVPVPVIMTVTVTFTFK
jgi:periplasmic protein TonB